MALRLVDRKRRIALPGGGSEPRRILTYVRYPIVPARSTSHARAGPFPLMVFGHGFTLTPKPYAALLDAWTRAGYVVAAPVFPLENANAPGGPNETDLPQQPGDVRLVTSALLKASAASTGPLRNMIDPARIAVSGHSDGGDTALAVAYNRYDRDPRVRAAVILSGAKIPRVGGFNFPRGSPPLLAVQGTADTINPPSMTYDFFDAAHPPKYLLTLLGASHLAPYTDPGPQRRTVERVTIAFLDRYLTDDAAAGRRLRTLGRVPGVSVLRARP